MAAAGIISCRAPAGNAAPRRISRPPHFAFPSSFPFFRVFIRRGRRGLFFILSAEGKKMRVNGEIYFLLNVGLDFCVMLLSARLLRVRARLPRLLASSLAGGVYALLAIICPPLSSIALLLPAVLLFSLIAFGRAGLRAFPAVLAGGLFLSGFLSLAIKQAWPRPLILSACAAAVTLCCYLLARGKIAAASGLTVCLTYKNRTCALPAFRDSGNTLFDALTGLPVLVVPCAAARGLLPPGVDPRRLATLPPGFRLLRVRTAAGEKMLMCFHPDQITLKSGKASLPVDAVAALSDFSEKRALLPEALFQEANFHQEAM